MKLCSNKHFRLESFSTPLITRQCQDTIYGDVHRILSAGPAPRLYSPAMSIIKSETEHLQSADRVFITVQRDLTFAGGRYAIYDALFLLLLRSAAG